MREQKKLRKDEAVKGKQRYKCKQCKCTIRENVQRYKYSLSKRLKVLKGYLEGLKIMKLERLEGVTNPLIIKCVKNHSKILKELIAKATLAETIKNAPILEMDELLLHHNKSCCWQNPKPNSRTLSWILK